MHHFCVTRLYASDPVHQCYLVLQHLPTAPMPMRLWTLLHSAVPARCQEVPPRLQPWTPATACDSMRDCVAMQRRPEARAGPLLLSSSAAPAPTRGANPWLQPCPWPRRAPGLWLQAARRVAYGRSSARRGSPAPATPGTAVKPAARCPGTSGGGGAHTPPAPAAGRVLGNRHRNSPAVLPLLHPLCTAIYHLCASCPSGTSTALSCCCTRVGMHINSVLNSVLSITETRPALPYIAEPPFFL